MSGLVRILRGYHPLVSGVTSFVGNDLSTLVKEFENYSADSSIFVNFLANPTHPSSCASVAYLFLVESPW